MDDSGRYALMQVAPRGDPLSDSARSLDDLMEERKADVAAAVLFFISDEADFLTGVVLDVDGGAHLGFLPGT